MTRFLRVVLTGGPEALSDTEYVHDTPPSGEKVKIAYAAGHEHYTANGETRVVDGETLPVYSWTDRTSFAE
ncbi:DUF5988 family protein [Actinophytocola oryzae]|uniref:DUF5988 family protein n=1 Tax=Actinophytocola oryzae TaxID=502181 RepID=UPI0010630EBD|nr:DUF5988 family protein [Actinophytocola oryzae]